MLGKMQWRQLAAWTAALTLLLFTVAVEGKSLRGVEVQDQSPQYVPNSFIVQFDPDQVAANAWEDALSAYVADVSHRLSMEIIVTHTYESPEIHLGAAIQLQPASKTTMDWSLSDAGRREIIHALKSSPAVQRVTKNQYLQPPASVHDRGSSIGAGESNLQQAALDRFEQPKARAHARDLGKRSHSSIDASHAMHAMMGVDIQHKKGNLGKGVTVCVVDGIVDFSHPVLNGGRPAGVDCMGGDCPVQGGYDYVGPDFDLVHRHPGPPKSKNACGHATQVASIVAGRDPDGRILGIAPDAKLRTYGVFSCSFKPFNTSSGGTTVADAFDIYDRAYKDKCDVLCGPLSATRGWQEAETLVASRLAQQGVTLVYSAANNGDSGPFLMGSPALGEEVVAVGSVSNAILPGWALAIDPPLPDGTSTLRVFTDTSWNYNCTVPKLPIRFSKAALADPDIKDEGCSPLGDDVVGGEDYILVVFQASACGFQKQIDNIADKDVKYLLRIVSKDFFLVSYPTEVKGTHNNATVTMAMLPTDMGLALYEAYKKNPSIQATFSPGGAFDVLTDYPHPSAGLMSYFSSWGPDNELKLVKPDVVGIGSDTLGAVPLPVRYAITAGNSFSTPTVSGAVALYKSVHGRNVSSASVRRALKHTATRVKRRDGGGDESLFWAGAGLVNITAAIDLTTEADPIDFNFGASPITEYHKQLIIKNVGTKKQSYNVTHIPAQSVYLLEEGAPEKRLTVNSSMISAIPQNADATATMSLYQNVFDLEPGKTYNFEFRIDPPPDHPRIIMYSGRISVICLNDPSGTANVPYTGMAGSLRTIPSLVTGANPFSTYLPALFEPGNKEQIRNDSTVWALDPEDPTSSPNLVYMTQTPTERLVIDIVDADIHFQATIPIVDDAECCNSTLPTEGPERRDLVSLALREDGANMTVSEMNSGKVTGMRWTKFDEVPIVGRMTDDDITGRDQYSNTLLPGGTFQTWPLTATLDLPPLQPKGDPSSTTPSSTPFSLPAGRYRVLLRAHRLRGGPLDEMSEYDSYLSRVWEYRKKREEGKGKGKGEKEKEGE